MQLTKNFHLSEFHCKDGTPVPEKLIPNAKKVAEGLQIIRDEANAVYSSRGEITLVVNSGYRTESHNRKVKGAKDSQHLTASAGDVYSSKLTVIELYKLILRLQRHGKLHNGGLGIYETFVHFDIRPYEVKF